MILPLLLLPLRSHLHLKEAVLISKLKCQRLSECKFSYFARKISILYSEYGTSEGEMDNSLLIIFQVAMWPMFPALFTVDMTESSFLAEFRGNVTMECRFPTGGGETLSSLRVYWHRILPEPLLEVYKLESGKEDLSTQHPRYKGRVNLQKDRLKQGQAVLQMSNLTISDSGKYRCIVEQGGADYKEATLNVRAAYTPIKTDIRRTPDDEKVELTCESEGYPLAKVIWSDASGLNLTSNANESIFLLPDQRYHIKSCVIVNNTVNNTYTCTFWNESMINYATNLTIPDDMKKTEEQSPAGRKSSTIVWAIMVVAAIVVTVAILVNQRFKDVKGLKRSKRKEEDFDALSTALTINSEVPTSVVTHEEG
ncbi:programmed cell death 1 ligand 1-like isoform X2 [Lepisosteus oculatus]